MRWSLATGAVQLALRSGAVALAPLADLELAPEAGVSPQPASWRQHSRSVLKELVAPSAAAWLDGTDDTDDTDDTADAAVASRRGTPPSLHDAGPRILEMAVPAPPPEVPTQPPQFPPPRLDYEDEVGAMGDTEQQRWVMGDAEQLRGWGQAGDGDELDEEDVVGAYTDGKRGGDFCNGRPIYDGPAISWEDCRNKCRPPCKFWSFGRESVQPRCKLAIECSQRERDSGRVNASAYMETEAFAGVDDQDASEKMQASSTPEPREEAAPEVNETELAPELNETELQRAPNSRRTCSPAGSARRFAVSPDLGGWHDIGTAHHYADCASAAASMGYGSIAWHTGSISKGRCYGFASDVPEITERSCVEMPVKLASPTHAFFSTALSGDGRDSFDRFADCWLFGPTSCDEFSGSSGSYY